MSDGVGCWDGDGDGDGGDGSRGKDWADHGLRFGGSIVEWRGLGRESWFLVMQMERR
jgi:hypothetical protein